MIEKEFVVSYERYTSLNESKRRALVNEFDGEEVDSEEEYDEEGNPITEGEDIEEEDEDTEEEEETEEAITETLDSMEKEVSKINTTLINELRDLDYLNESSEYSAYDLHVDTIAEMVVKSNDIASLEILNEMLENANDSLNEASAMSFIKNKAKILGTKPKRAAQFISKKAKAVGTAIGDKLKALAKWFKEGIAKIKAIWAAKMAKAKNTGEKKGFKVKMQEALAKFTAAFKSRKEKITNAFKKKTKKVDLNNNQIA